VVALKTLPRSQHSPSSREAKSAIDVNAHTAARTRENEAGRQLKNRAGARATKWRGKKMHAHGGVAAESVHHIAKRRCNSAKTKYAPSAM